MRRKAKTGPKPENGVGRTRLMGCGPVVSRATNDALKLWRDVHGVPLGRAIDAMFEHVKDNPAFRIPKRGIMSKAKLGREVQNQWTEAITKFRDAGGQNHALRTDDQQHSL